MSLLAAVPLSISIEQLGIATAFAAVALVLVALYLARRRRPGREIKSLGEAERGRYNDQFAAIERDFEVRPAVAISQARGTVEEVLRRMGFPDRIEVAQKARDLAAHDRQAADALATADSELRQGGADPEALQRALAGYRSVLDRLLGTAAA